MCTSFLNSWNGTAVNLRERVAMVVTARSAERIDILSWQGRDFAEVATKV
jgi:hypothetical protein